MKKQQQNHETQRKQISEVAYKMLMADYDAFNRKDRAKKSTKKR